MQCGTSHLQTVTYHFWRVTVVIVRFTQNVSSNMSLCNNSSDNKIHRVDVGVSAHVTTVTYMHQSQPSSHLLRNLTWQSLDLGQCHLNRALIFLQYFPIPYKMMTFYTVSFNYSPIMSDWVRDRDANPVPTSQLATAPPEPVFRVNG